MKDVRENIRVKVFVFALCSLVLAASQGRGESLFDLSPSKSLKVLNSAQRTEIEGLSNLPLNSQAEAIQKKVDIEILASGRKGEHYFDFIGEAKKALDEVPNVEGLYGKVVCPQGDQKSLIYLADDAPPTTLIHQYIHFLQIKNENRWCELQGRVLDSAEKNEQALIYHRFEFETLKILFDLQDKLTMNFEDRLLLLEGLNRENTLLVQANIQALDEAHLQKLKKSLEVIHSQINYLKWLKRSPDDAKSVMQKMEVFNIDLCAQASKDEDLFKKVNACLEKRCTLSRLKCQALTPNLDGENSLALATRGWTQNHTDTDCNVPKLRDEILDNLREPTPCWKSWSDAYAKKSKGGLETISERELKKNFKVPELKIDKKISFQKVFNPEVYIEKTYCYSIFDKVAGFGIIPVEQFAYASQGTIINYSKLSDYRKWLEGQEGKICTKLVKLFSGQPASPFAHIDKHKKYMFVINTIAALSGGVKTYGDLVVSDINHERLHLIYAEDKSLKAKIKKEWSALSSAEQNEFKNKHQNYDFSDEDVLLREYFAFSRQDRPTHLF